MIFRSVCHWSRLNLQSFQNQRYNPFHQILEIFEFMSDNVVKLPDTKTCNARSSCCTYLGKDILELSF